MQAQLQGQRICLRPPRMADVDEIWRQAREYAIARYTTVPHPYPRRFAVQFIRTVQREARSGQKITLAITDAATDQVIGMMELGHIDRVNKSAEIGYWVGKKHWRKGFGTEAAIRLLQYAFSKLKLHRIHAQVFEQNDASANLLLRLGFDDVGTVRHAMKRRGRWANIRHFSLLADEFRNIKPSR